jgi:hypothetical protein
MKRRAIMLFVLLVLMILAFYAGLIPGLSEG